MTTKELGDRIRAGRLSREMTQDQLAKRIKVAPSTVAMWEAGKREPNMQMLEALADVYNVPRTYFMADDPDAVTDLSDTDRDILEALHQNPKLGMLFDRQRNMSASDIDMMLTLAERIMKERDS